MESYVFFFRSLTVSLCLRPRSLIKRDRRLPMLQEESIPDLRPVGGSVMAIEVGQTIKGKVTGIQSFGAFVALDDKNTQGLVHISEVSNTFVKDINEFLKVGDEVEVKVIKVDEATKKISLSIRALMPNPEGNKAPRAPKEKDGEAPRRRAPKNNRRQAAPSQNYKSDPDTDAGYTLFADKFNGIEL